MTFVTTYSLTKCISIHNYSENIFILCWGVVFTPPKDKPRLFGVAQLVQRKWKKRENFHYKIKGVT